MKPTQLISYQYPNTLHISIKGKLYTYFTSEHWARKVMRQMEYGGGWRAVGWLKVNGKLVNGGDANDGCVSKMFANTRDMVRLPTQKQNDVTLGMRVGRKEQALILNPSNGGDER